MRIRSSRLCTMAMITFLSAAGAVRAGPISVVDIIPFLDSREQEQNAEPSLGVNPTDPTQMVAGAFTGQRTDFITLSNEVSQVTTPFFASTTGGRNWFNFGSLQTADKSIAWKQDGSAALIATANPNPGKTNRQISTFSGQIGFAGLTNLDNFDPNQQLDQPWIRTGPKVLDPAAGLLDPVYVGYNNGDAANGKTASVNISLEGGKNYTSVTIDRAAGTPRQDAPSVRLAVNGNTVYAVFTRWNDRVVPIVDAGDLYHSDVVVVRSDFSGTDNFRDLADGGRGVTVAHPTSPFTVELNSLVSVGQERATSENAIAVDPDPKKAAHVVVAYVDTPALGQMQVVVSESTDSGDHWTEKFRTPASTRSAQPALTILANGVIVLLYDNYEPKEGDPKTGKLSQHLLATADDFLHTRDTTLATAVNDVPEADVRIGPYVGDFFDMTSIDNTLYGVFSASNFDDGTNASFPNGVTFQRDHKGAPGMAGFELRDGSTAGAHIDPSIDPFFFTVNLEDLEFPCGIDCTILLPLTLVVPEPASLAILGVALAGFGLARRRSKAV